MLPEAEADEAPEFRPEMLRPLATSPPDGSTLVVADEQRRSDETLRRVMTAFAWALGGTIALGAAGGLLGSAHNSFAASNSSCAAPRGGSWRGTGAGGFRSPWSTTIFRPSPTRSIARSTASRRFCWPTSTPTADDLRKPLSHVLGRLEAARSGDGGPAAVAEAIEGATAEVEGVLETFDALLRIGQIEAGARRAGFEKLDLAQIARDVVDAFRPAAEEQGRALVACLDEPLPLQGDRELLIQMIANCLDNALIHTPPGVRIEVEGAVGPTGAMLSIADSGPGVPQGDLTKLFDPFFRSDASRTSPGSGLGLRLVAAIAELHGLVCSVSAIGWALKVTVATTPRDD